MSRIRTALLTLGERADIRIENIGDHALSNISNCLMGQTFNNIDFNKKKMINYKPRCCACSDIASGRVCYAGKYSNVVDNPFCNKHFLEVYKQTVILIDDVHKGKTEGEFVLVQRWSIYQPVPNLPFNIVSLLKAGQKVSVSDV